MAKNVAKTKELMPSTEKGWEARNDADLLKKYFAIKGDVKRLAAARNVLKEEVEADQKAIIQSTMVLKK